ncbi:MAG: SRPBCC domain-containing protein [Pseudomonadota bacterium]
MSNKAHILGYKEEPAARRTINATAEDLFNAWIMPELIEQWWGPDGFTTKVQDLDPRPSGRYAFEMISPSGSSCVMAGVYKTVQRPIHLVFEVHDHCNLDLPEGTMPQSQASVVHVTFEEMAGKTTVTVWHTSLNKDYAWLAATSWAHSLEKLETMSK